MTTKPLTTAQFFRLFPDDETCLNHLFEVRFGQGFTCPKCGRASKWFRIKAERAYSCQWCGHHLVKKGKHNRGSAAKTVVVGALERNGDVVAQVVPNQRRATLEPFVTAILRHRPLIASIPTDGVPAGSGLRGSEKPL